MPPIACHEANFKLNRLLLTPIKASHAQVMFPILADKQLYTFTGDEPPESEQALRSTYRKLESRKSPDKSQLWLNWLISIVESGTTIGYVQATVSEFSADIAWLTGTKWQKRGFASEAATGLVGWLSANEMPLIRALISPNHKASQKVASNAGLTKSNLIEANEDVWVFRPT